jgi:hypothetical protein
VLGQMTFEEEQEQSLFDPTSILLCLILSIECSNIERRVFHDQRKKKLQQ